MLKNEALILKEMDHPNIVKFYDVNKLILLQVYYLDI